MQFYFALLIYSYASHLRKGSYRALPLSRSTPVLSAQVPSHYENGAALYDDTALGLGEDEDGVDDFYRVPLRTPEAKLHLSAHKICCIITIFSFFLFSFSLSFLFPWETLFCSVNKS